MTKNVKTLPTREQIPVDRTWDLEAIYPTDEAWEAEFAEVKSSLPTLEAFRGKLAESADTFYKALQKEDEISQKIGKLYAYAHMRYDQDTTNSFYQGLNDRVMGLAAQVGKASSFITPEILSIDEEKIAQFLIENEELKLYEHALERLNRSRPHILSEAEEKILAQASEVTKASSNVFSIFNNADLKFPTIKDENGEEVEVTHGRYIRFLESEDRRVRKDAFTAMYATYEKYINTFATTLSGQVKKDIFYADVRQYDSARQAALSSNHIPEIVYDQLVSTINEHLPLLHRYVRLRKKALGLDELHMYDLYTPLIQDSSMEVNFDEAKEFVLKGVAPLGEEYVQIVQEGYDKRWIDVEENVGKRSGAYSSGTYGTMPYILINWQNNVNNLFTLAHELGHSVHSYYTRKHQPYPYGDYTIFVAEVASITNEILLNEHLLKITDDKKQKLYLLNHFLEGFRGTVFRQTMFSEFEQLIHAKAHEGVALTAELLTNLYYDLNVKYFGEDVVIDKEIGYEWARIPHFYYNFYVYQYATGYSAATALANQILTEGEPAVKRYIDFLKAGNSDYPIEVLKKAGVDMTSADPIKAACEAFAKTLDEMEQLLTELD